MWEGGRSKVVENIVPARNRHRVSFLTLILCGVEITLSALPPCGACAALPAHQLVARQFGPYVSQAYQF